jgi:hypothetical protein
MSKQKLIWKKQPEPGDYAGALKFLMLIYAEAHVEEDLTRIRKGKSLAPVLLRICAICYYDENAPIPCRLASAR